jgi:hypothetical protein
MLTLLYALQAEDEVAPPFGQFMEAVPHWAFIVIHSTLILMAFVLSRRARTAGYQTAAGGFLLFCLAELSYITYHLHVTHFLLAHTVAEVLDALAFLTIGVGLVRKK